MKFAQWLIFEDIKEDFNKCAINLVEIKANSLLKQALETKGFIEENTNSEILSEVWDSSEISDLSENLENCNCSSLMSKSRVPVDCCSLKCLKDSMIQVRLGAIQQRKKDILDLEKLNDKLMQVELEIQKDPEDIFLKDDLEEVAKEQKNLIKKLGYASKKFLQNFYPDGDDSIEKLKNLTAIAIKEKNEVPEEMEIYLNKNATNDFGNLLAKMFITDEKTMERASDIFLTFVKRLTKKNVKDGTWQNFAGLKGTLEDLEDTACDDSDGTVKGSKSGPTLNKLSQFMKSQIYGIKKSPEDLGIKNPQKNMLGKKFSRSSKMQVVSHDLGNPFGKTGRAKENLTFYKDALKALQDGDPDLIDTLTSGRTKIPALPKASSAAMARYRREIIEDIFYSRSTNKTLYPLYPPNDQNIRKSLESYYKFMKAGAVKYAVNIGQDKGDEEISKKGIEGMSGGGPDILQQLSDKEELGILEKMKDKLRKMLLSKNEEEMQQALAFCIKYGLNCNNFENPKIDKDVIKIDSKGKMEKKPGLKNELVALELSKKLNKKITDQKARSLAMGAEEKIRFAL